MERKFIVILEPGEAAAAKRTESIELAQLQGIVGGYIEVAPTPKLGDDIVLLCNEEGKIEGLTQNLDVGDDLICGTVCFVGVAGEEFCPLDEAQVERIERWLQLETDYIGDVEMEEGDPA